MVICGRSAFGVLGRVGVCVHVSKLHAWRGLQMPRCVLFCSCGGDARVEEHEIEGVRLWFMYVLQIARFHVCFSDARVQRLAYLHSSLSRRVTWLLTLTLFI